MYLPIHTTHTSDYNYILIWIITYEYLHSYVSLNWIIIKDVIKEQIPMEVCMCIVQDMSVVLPNTPVDFAVVGKSIKNEWPVNEVMRE